MPDIRGLVSDPDFQALPPGRQRALLQRAGAPPEFVKELLGEADLAVSREAITAPAVQGAVERRNAALAENLARVDPRLAAAATIDPRAAAFAGAMPLALAAATPARTVLPFARGAAPVARAVGSVAKDLAISQGVEELAKATGIPGAGAVAELMLGGKAVKTGAKALLEKSFAKWAAERAAAGGARAAAPIVATAAKVAAEGVTPSTVAAVARQIGREVKPDYPAVLAFAKNAGKGGKKGEKIWMLLDDAGKPVKRLTSDQAGAAARAGKPTTFFSNLWGSATPVATRAAVKAALPKPRFFTSQSYLDPAIVEAKSKAKDYVVSVVPVPEAGEGALMVADGHHALAAALRDGVKPIIKTVTDKDYLAGKASDAASWLARHQDDADYRWVDDLGELANTVW